MDGDNIPRVVHAAVHKELEEACRGSDEEPEEVRRDSDEA